MTFETVLWRVYPLPDDRAGPVVDQLGAAEAEAELAPRWPRRPPR